MKRFGVWLMVILMLVSTVPMASAAESTAKGAILIDGTTGTVLAEHNAHQALPPASVTKVMTMLLVMEALDSGRIGWDDPVTASEAAAGKGGSQIYLKVGETMTVTELLKSVAVSSANDAACALAEYVAGSEAAFVEQMNVRAKELGMESTHFVNCTGLDDDPEAKKHLTSAYDIALMSRELLMHHPDIQKFTTIWMDTVRDGTFGLANTNKLVRFYPGCIGLKTGYTSGSGFSLSAAAQRDGMTLIAVVLGCESSADRFATCKGLLDRGFASYALIDPKLEPMSVPVVLGKAGQVAVELSGEGAMLIDKGQVNTVRYQTQLEESVTAPVSKGQRLGTMTVYAGEQVLAQLPLVAAEPVERQGFWDIFRNVLKKVCFAG